MRSKLIKQPISKGIEMMLIIQKKRKINSEKEITREICLPSSVKTTYSGERVPPSSTIIKRVTLQRDINWVTRISLQS
jgi:hypothetical protein